MAESVTLVDPKKLSANPSNPRLIFRADELESLQKSIETQGILVPLTVYRDGKGTVLLDGERRWRCALKLGMQRVPVIFQPKPDKMGNLMMMFAIHNARKDWDPLPTALKLEELEKEFTHRNGRKPTEAELAGVASISRGEVRRYKKLLGLPHAYREELLAELELPRSEQRISVDHVIETTKAAEALRKADIIEPEAEEDLRRAILKKFRSGIIDNTVAPRKLVKLASAVSRQEITVINAGKIVQRLIDDPKYSIDEAFQQSVEEPDFERGLEQIATRLLKNLEEHDRRGYRFSDRLMEVLQEVERRIKRLRQA